MSQDSFGGLLSLLTILLIISLFVNLFFINSKLMNRLKERNLSKKLPSLIQKHLESQAYKTANAHKFNYIPKLHDVVVKFRSAYLKLEARCIDRGVDSEAYWNLLNSKLFELLKLASNFMGGRPLLKIKKKIELIKSLVNDSSLVSDKDRILACLDSFYKVCDVNSNERKIIEYDKKLNKIILRFTDKYYAKLDRLVKVNADMLENAKGVVGKLEDTVAGFEDISAKMDGEGESHNEFLRKSKGHTKEIQEGVGNVKDSLYQLEQKIHSIEGQGCAEEGSEFAKKSALALSELSEQILEENEKEIARLRRVIESQKQVITELEEKLKLMVAELDSDETLSAAEKQRSISMVESLRNNLRDAEHCISVLEGEVESLRLKTGDIQSEFECLGESDSLPIGESEVLNLESVIEALKSDVESKSLENESLKIVANFVGEIFSAETFEDLSLLLYETFRSMNVEAVLKIYSPSRTFEVCAAGKIPTRLSMVIDNLHVNETSKNSGTFFFKHKNFGGAVKLDSKKNITDQESAHILMVAAIANKRLESVRLLNASRLQQRKLGECENNMKRTFSEIDSAFEKISDNASKAVEESFKQVRLFARSAGLNASQIASLSQLETAVSDEINSETATRLKVKKSFLEALRELESIRF